MFAPAAFSLLSFSRRSVRAKGLQLPTVDLQVPVLFLYILRDVDLMDCVVDTKLFDEDVDFVPIWSALCVVKKLAR